MEVNSQKQLHKHAALAVLLTLVLFGVTTTALAAFQSGSVSTEIALGRGLVTQVLHIQPTTNGLARITTTSTKTVTLTTEVNQAGQAAQLTLMLQ